MYGFMTRLAVTEAARQGWFSVPEWELIEPLIYKKKNGEIVNVPVGFITDLASIPKFLHILIGPAGAYSKSAVLHDYLIYTNEEPSLTNDLFYEAMILDSVPMWLAKQMYNAVKMFGKHNVGVIKFAPVFKSPLGD